MAKTIEWSKRKKRWILGLSLAMATTIALGVFSACKTPDNDNEEEEDSAALPTDTQILKNGNFEFYTEMTKEEKELRAILNTPTSWSFSSGSPSSDTKSGLVDLKYWDSVTKSKREFTSVSDAYTNWEEGSIYDKLYFYYKCDNPNNNSEYDPFEDAYDALANSSAEKKFFNEHAFSSVDFEDVQYLRSELGEKVALHGDTDTKDQEERGVLMIHNRRTSDGAVGTAQSYSSSTTITLKAGTAAQISVWVKTAQLRHYYSDLNGSDDSLDGLKVTSEAGAYIGVTQTVGGTTLDQMQIKNINTEVTNPDANDNGWEKYTVYVRASTFATTTVRLVLGLGQGNSEDRYEAVNGYALFDDVEFTVIDNDAYVEATDSLTANYTCDIDDKKKDKLFDATYLYDANKTYAKTFAIDLYAGFNKLNLTTNSIGLTEEKSGNTVYTSEKIDSSLSDNRSDPTKGSVIGFKSLADIKNSTNGYLKNIAENDFAEFPSSFSQSDILLLLSTNGAAYTAKTTNFSLAKDERLLISFFVKTSKIITGRTGASITLVDGENKTAISAFDSTTVETVDVNDENTDIYNGWVQCFFFVSNDTEEVKEFSLEFSYGPTAIASSDKYDYGQGYAAFANFESQSLSKTELSYASTNDRAKKVSLTGLVEDTTVFDSATASSDIEHGLGTPLSFKGVLAGSDWMVPNSETENKIPNIDGTNDPVLAAGLINHKYVDNYSDVWNSEINALIDGKTGEDAWKAVFGDANGRTALQPLAIVNKTNTAQPSYGYFAEDATISASSYQKISLRVKLSAGAKASIYLTDVSEFSNKGYNSFLASDAPKITYWYDDDGNICKSDPTEKDFKKETGTAFELQKNGLYQKVDSEDKSYYANLKNYKEKDGNLVTKSDTIAFYGNEGSFYAYRTENSDGSYSYSQIVKDLYENGGKEIARYDFTEKTFPESVIKVENTTSVPTDWITLTFYVHTGSEAKNYRLEVWAGDRDNAENGIPANGYVFFDRYASSSVSNYDSLLSEAIADLEDDEDMVLDQNGNLPESIANYYTFTFYDSANYLRYDVNEDEDELGNPYASYRQSSHSEELVYLIYNDADGSRTGVPSYIRFLNYGASDVTVEPDNLTADEEEPDDSETTPISTGDILLICSSALLGVVLIFVIVMLLVRRFAGKRMRKTRVSPAKDKRYKPSKKSAVEEETEEENPFVKNRMEKEANEEKPEEGSDE